MSVAPIVAAKPGMRILLAEDDAVSRAFLAEVLAADAEIEIHVDGASALASVRDNRFDCVVLDRRLPKLGGAEIATALRSDATTASHRARLVALSAGLDAEGERRLLGAGFDCALAKPVPADVLRAAVRGDTPGPASNAEASMLPVLDDAAALRALAGDPSTVTRLRRLFAAELPAQIESIGRLAASQDPVAARDHLHRLQASCGFCGALELADASRMLAAAIAGRGDAGAALRRFLAAGKSTRSALADP